MGIPAKDFVDMDLNKLDWGKKKKVLYCKNCGARIPSPKKPHKHGVMCLGCFIEQNPPGIPRCPR